MAVPLDDDYSESRPGAERLPAYGSGPENPGAPKSSPRSRALGLIALTVVSTFVWVGLIWGLVALV